MKGLITGLSLCALALHPGPALAQPDDASGRFILRSIGRDLLMFPSTETVVTPAVGGGLALAVHPSDSSLVSRAARSADLGSFLRIGAAAGSGWAQVGGAFGTWAVGTAAHSRKVQRLGADLIRAQTLNIIVIDGLKAAVRLGDHCSGGSASAPSRARGQRAGLGAGGLRGRLTGAGPASLPERCPLWRGDRPGIRAYGDPRTRAPPRHRPAEPDARRVHADARATSRTESRWSSCADAHAIGTGFSRRLEKCHEMESGHPDRCSGNIRSGSGGCRRDPPGRGAHATSAQGAGVCSPPAARDTHVSGTGHPGGERHGQRRAREEASGPDHHPVPQQRGPLPRRQAASPESEPIGAITPRRDVEHRARAGAGRVGGRGGASAPPGGDSGRQEKAEGPARDSRALTVPDSGGASDAIQGYRVRLVFRREEGAGSSGEGKAPRRPGNVLSTAT